MSTVEYIRYNRKLRNQRTLGQSVGASHRSLVKMNSFDAAVVTPLSLSQAQTERKFRKEIDFDQASEIVSGLQSDRGRIEKMLGLVGGAISFGETLRKSNEVVACFIKENWVQCKEKAEFLSRIAELERNLIKNIQETAGVIEGFKRAEVNLSKVDNNLAIANRKLKNKIEGLKVKLDLCEKQKVNLGLKEKRLWKTEKAEFEIRFEEISKELQGYKERELRKTNGEFQTRAIAYPLLVELSKKKELELRTIIYKLQLELGTARDLIEEQKIVIEEVKVPWKKETDELIHQSYNRTSMLIEDLIAISEYKYQYHLALRTIRNLQETLAFYERSANSSEHTKNLINFNDPIFSVFKINQAAPNPNFTSSSLVTKNSHSATPEFSPYTYSKPGFATFVKLPKLRNVKLPPPHPLWLELTIRALFDSKYNEHLYKGGTLPTAFPEFVYSWLEDYEVNEETRKIQRLDTWKGLGPNDLRVLLLVSMSDSETSARKVWEIYSFKEFFCEDAGIDELEFYLRCRNLLFEGPQLDLHEGKFDQFHYSPLSKVFQTIEKTVIADSEVMKDLYRMLEGRSCLVNGQTVIESSLALRVLLENYRYNKQSMVKEINSMFENAPKEAGGVTFQSFRDITAAIDSSLSHSEVVKLYRNTWVVGNHRVTSHAFLTICNENGLFYRLAQRQKSHSGEQCGGDIGQGHIDRLKKKMNKIFDSLGVPEFRSTYKDLKEVMKLNSESNYFPRQLMIFFTKLSIIMQSKYPGFENNSLASACIHINGNIKPFFLSEIKAKISARKIQRWYRSAKQVAKQ